MLQLPDIATDAGVFVRVLLAECRNPGSNDYTLDDAKLCFRLMQATIANRLANHPGQFGAPGATTYEEIVTAPHQFQDFSDNNGTLTMTQRVSDLIDRIVTQANTGDPGDYTDFFQAALDRANAQPDDPLSGVTSVNGTAVIGGTYAWVTAGTSSPGGRFFAVPAAFGGLVMNNQFYTLLSDDADI